MSITQSIATRRWVIFILESFFGADPSLKWCPRLVIKTSFCFDFLMWVVVCFSLSSTFSLGICVFYFAAYTNVFAIRFPCTMSVLSLWTGALRCCSTKRASAVIQHDYPSCVLRLFFYSRDRVSRAERRRLSFRLHDAAVQIES